ncbi:MAG: hypothetical protein HQ558_06745 [Candidatus Omnitrophica bacterium]|nr:hypothetical protein [Candidatus Omnitrophota bacterium]
MVKYGGMEKARLTIIICVALLLSSAGPLMAAGEIKRLLTIKESMDLQQKESDQEADNYSKADAFFNGPDIVSGLSAEAVVAQCGQPVAKADDGLRWVYKPPSSTFFEGEKIYFYFDKDNTLLSWEKIYQR